MKVKDHDHVTRKFRTFAYLRIFNLNLSLSKKIIAAFNNLKSHDSHLIFQEIEKYHS